MFSNSLLNDHNLYDAATYNIGYCDKSYQDVANSDENIFWGNRSLNNSNYDYEDKSNQRSGDDSSKRRSTKTLHSKLQAWFDYM